MQTTLRVLVSAWLAGAGLWGSLAHGQASTPIPHARIVHGKGNIATAWLAEATRRYGHGVLGDDIEAAALVVVTREGKRHTLRLTDESVFEDLTPRLADIDGDGRDEVWTVRSDATDGARLEAYGLISGAVQRVFAADPIGKGYRWLNPVGIDDFDGDGRKEAAYVQTPHIGGILTIVRPHGSRLVVVARARGYSNHALGSTRLDLAAVADLDGDGSADIVLPDQERRQLVVVSLVNGALVERWRSASGAVVAGGLTLVPDAAGWLARFLALDGATAVIAIPTQALRRLR